jgi:Domain of unknown function (DUF5615)
VVDEALRTREHPGITFRPGPAGRRAGLASGPDVWEVVRVIRSARSAEPGLAEDALIARSKTTPARQRVLSASSSRTGRLAQTRSTRKSLPPATLRQRPKTPGGANATFSPGRNVSYPLLDEMLSGAIAEQLRAKGHDALAVADDPALISLPDDQILAHATTAGRALVTANIKDFMPLDAQYRAAGQAHAMSSS